MINKRIILLLAISILFASCSSNEEKLVTSQEPAIEESETESQEVNILEPGESIEVNINTEETLETQKETIQTSEVEETNFPPTFPEENWRNIGLKNVNTNEKYKISDFSGEKKVLLESFAVWCPTCTRQQEEVKRLHIAIGDKVESIALNTDPNEEEEKVRNHAEKNKFDWKYSVSPSELTKQLVDEFGIGIVNAPSAPMLLICEDQSNVHFLDNGLKERDELREYIETLC